MSNKNKNNCSHARTVQQPAWVYRGDRWHRDYVRGPERLCLDCGRREEGKIDSSRIMEAVKGDSLMIISMEPEAVARISSFRTLVHEPKKTISRDEFRRLREAGPILSEREIRRSLSK